MPHYYLRAGNKWTIPELIALQREYELLELTVQEIAQRHKRTVFAIVARLESEGLVKIGATCRGDSVNEDDTESVVDDEDDRTQVLLANPHAKDKDYKSGDSDSESDEDDDDEDYDDESDVNKLSDRVWNLETSVNEIGGIVKQMMELMSNDRQAHAQSKSKSKSKSKRSPLRGQNQCAEE
jgi:hypothetical protein